VFHGVNITTVQKLLGHRNVATTQIYSEIMESTIVNDLKRCAKEKQTNIHLEENFQTKEQ
jgi:site-specific recombinase XerD